MIVVAGGANLSLPAPRPAPIDLTGYTVFLSQLETPVAAVRALFEDVRAGGAMTLLNAAPALAEGAPLFPLANVVIVNETELARYTDAGATPKNMEEVVPLARRLISREGQSVVVTLGSHDVAAVDAEPAFVNPCSPPKVVKTTVDRTMVAWLSPNVAARKATMAGNPGGSIVSRLKLNPYEW